LKYSFAALLGPSSFTRKYGGTLIGVADPYLTGYHFIMFEYLPPMLPKYTVEFNSAISSDPELKAILSGSCLSVTPPGGTINKVEFTGLGGVKWAVPGNIDYTNSVSVKFLEFNRTPILDIFSGWFKLIRDYRTGVTDLVDTSMGSGYTKATYAAVMYYWTTAPDGVTVEFFACYDGVFPIKDPSDLYGSDVENVGKVEVEIEFNVDYQWREPWVYRKCQMYANANAANKSLVKNYQY